MKPSKTRWTPVKSDPQLDSFKLDKNPVKPCQAQSNAVKPNETR